MNRTLYAVALFAALGTAGLVHAQTNPTPPATKPSTPAPVAPSPVEPIKQIPDPGLPNSTSTVCGTAMPARIIPPANTASAQTNSPTSTVLLSDPAAPSMKRAGPRISARLRGSFKSLDWDKGRKAKRLPSPNRRHREKSPARWGHRPGKVCCGGRGPAIRPHPLVS
jgi:hypothetical protein